MRFERRQTRKWVRVAITSRQNRRPTALTICHRTVVRDIDPVARCLPSAGVDATSDRRRFQFTAKLVERGDTVLFEQNELQLRCVAARRFRPVLVRHGAESRRPTPRDARRNLWLWITSWILNACRWNGGLKVWLQHPLVVQPFSLWVWPSPGFGGAGR